MQNHRTFEGLAIKDKDAEKRLISLLDRAIAELGQLNSGLVLVAECPDKFNDADNDDYWRAIQVNEAYWEQSYFFKHRTEPLFEAQTDYAGDKKLPIASNILKELEENNWRAEAMACLDGFGDLLCLALDHGQPLLCMTNPIDAEGDVWTWNDSGLHCIASCERIDERIGDPNPIGLTQLHSAIWDYLTPAARSYLNPTVRDSKAYAQLCELLADVADRARQITSEQVLLVAPTSRPWPGNPPQEFAAYISVGEEVGDSRTVPPLPPRYPWRTRHQDKQQFSSLLQQADSLLLQLESAKWRKLFDASMSPFPDGHLLALLVKHETTLLIWELSVFELKQNSLEFRGLTDRMNCWAPGCFPSLHPFE